MQVDNLCNLDIKKEHTRRGRGWESWKPRYNLHLVAEGATPFLTQESDLMGIVFRKERNWCGRECEGGKSYWGDSHAGVDCINGEKEMTVEIWKAVTKIWLGEGRGGQGQQRLEGVSRLKHWEGSLSLLSFLTSENHSHSSRMLVLSFRIGPSTHPRVLEEVSPLSNFNLSPPLPEEKASLCLCHPWTSA